MHTPSPRNRLATHVKSDGKVRILPLVVSLTLAACIASIAVLVKTVWFSVDHERCCQDLRMKAFESFNKGDRAQARRLYQQAAKEAEQSDNVLQLPAVLSELTDVYRQEKDFANAEQSLTSSLQCYERIEKQRFASSTTPSSLLTDMVAKKQVEITIKLAKLLEEEGKLSQALSLYPKALVKAKNVPDAFDTEAEIKDDYASLLEKSGQISMARQIQADLAVNKSGFKGFETELQAAIQLFNQQKIDQAKQGFQIASLIAERHHQTKDIVTAHAWLGACLLVAGQPEQAEKIFKEVLASRCEVGCMSCSKILTNLAITLELQNKRQQEAEAIYKQALALNSADVLEDLTQVAGCYELKGAFATAEPLRKRVLCLESNCASLPSPTSLISHAEKAKNAGFAAHIFFLANNYEQQGKDAAARPLYEALQQIVPNMHNKDPLVAVVSLMVANYFCSKEEHAKAERIYDKAIAMLEGSQYKSEFGMTNLYANAGNNCRAMGKQKKSESLYRKELNIVLTNKEGQANHMIHAQCLLDLAGELTVQERYGEAKSVLQQFFVEYPKLDKEQRIQSSKNALGLANYLRKMGGPRQAEFFRQQIREIADGH